MSGTCPQDPDAKIRGVFLYNAGRGQWLALGTREILGRKLSLLTAGDYCSRSQY